MLRWTFVSVWVVVGLVVPATAEKQEQNSAMSANLNAFIKNRSAEFDQIPAERRARLDELAQYVAEKRTEGTPARLTFICTHNSRRSQIAQIWAAAAAAHYGIPHVETFSGGTEATAFNPRAVAALRRTGLGIDETKPGENPHYEVHFAGQATPLGCFSKVYNESPNPQKDFCAVMVCSQADKTCPIVRGSTARVAIPYDDPKAADGTPEESARYDERCRQIACEMLYVFSQVQPS